MPENEPKNELKNEPQTETEQPTEQNGSFARYAWTAILVIFMLGFGAYVVKTLVDEHNRTKIADQDRDKIAQEFAPPQEVEPTPDIRGPEPTSTPPKVLGSNTNNRVESRPQFKPYRNDAFGFSTMVPADAQLAVNNEKITANGPAGIYWTVTKYDNTTETLRSLETQLSQSPSVTTLARTKLGTLPALVFTSPNLQGATGYALIVNNRLYYLVGNFDRPELWRDWKFF